MVTLRCMRRRQQRQAAMHVTPFHLCMATGCQPADLYCKYTWKIPNFSDTNKRELRSKSFTVGDFKW